MDQITEDQENMDISNQSLVFHSIITPVKAQNEDMEIVSTEQTIAHFDSRNQRDSIAHFFSPSKTLASAAPSRPSVAKRDSLSKFFSPARSSLAHLHEISEDQEKSFDLADPLEKETTDESKTEAMIKCKNNTESMDKSVDEYADKSYDNAESMDISMDIMDAEPVLDQNDTIGRFFDEKILESTPRPAKADLVVLDVNPQSAIPVPSTPRSTLKETGTHELKGATPKRANRATPQKLTTPVNDRVSSPSKSVKNTPKTMPAKRTSSTPRQNNIQTTPKTSPLTRSRTKVIESAGRKGSVAKSSLALLAMRNNFNSPKVAKKSTDLKSIASPQSVRKSLGSARMNSKKLVLMSPELKDKVKHAFDSPALVTQNIFDPSAHADVLDSKSHDSPIKEVTNVQNDSDLNAVAANVLDTSVPDVNLPMEHETVALPESASPENSPVKESQKLASAVLDSIDLAVTASPIKFGDFNKDGDLMDEELSMLDNSILQEDSFTKEFEDIVPLKIDSLAEFMDAVGLNVVVQPLDTLEPLEVSFPNTNPHLSDYLKAATLSSELEIVKWGCSEMVNVIQDVHELLDQRMQEIDISQPMIFFDFANGTVAEREEIKLNMQAMREYCIEYSRSQYYEWKAQLIDPLFIHSQESMENLEEDQHAINTILNAALLLKGETETAKEKILEELKTLREMQQIEQSQTLSNIAQVEKEQQSQTLRIAELRKKISQAKKRGAELDQAVNVAENQVLKMSLVIEQSEETCKDLVVFDPENLALLRQEYSIMVMTHLWRPTKLSVAHQIWVYDGALQIEFKQQKPGLYSMSSTILNEDENKRISVLSGPIVTNTNIVNFFGPKSIQSLIKCGNGLSKSQMKTCKEHASFVWNNLKTLYRDIKDAEHICPITLGENFEMTATFFNIERKTKFEIVINSANYPIGQLNAKLVLIYGEFSHSLDFLQDIPNGPGWLSRVLFAIQSLVDQ